MSDYALHAPRRPHGRSGRNMARAHKNLVPRWRCNPIEPWLASIFIILITVRVLTADWQILPTFRLDASAHSCVGNLRSISAQVVGGSLDSGRTVRVSTSCESARVDKSRRIVEGV